MRLYLILTLVLGSFWVKSQDDHLFKDKYLIVLDMQTDYLKGRSTDSETIEFIRKVNSVISKVDSDKVIYVKTEMLVASLSFKGIRIDTVANLDFCDNLNIVSNNIFVKETGDAFKNPELMNLLKSKNAKDIIIVGLLAEQCIMRTTVGGLNQGLNIFVVPEAILGKSEKSKAKVFKKLQSKGAIVVR